MQNIYSEQLSGTSTYYDKNLSLILLLTLKNFKFDYFHVMLFDLRNCFCEIVKLFATVYFHTALYHLLGTAGAAAT